MSRCVQIRRRARTQTQRSGASRSCPDRFPPKMGVSLETSSKKRRCCEGPFKTFYAESEGFARDVLQKIGFAEKLEYSKTAVSLETSSKKQQFGELVLRRPSSKIAISLETSSENRDVECALLFASFWGAPKGLRNHRRQLRKMP